jgi:lipopolysaccharide transport system permease protein
MSGPLVLRPPSRWPRLDLDEIWDHRDLLWSLAVRDVKIRYRQTALGVLWVVLQPLLAAAVLAFVFGRVARVPTGGVPTFTIAFTGVLAWSAFAAALNRSAPTLVQNVTLVSKVYFPRTLLPLSAAAATLVDSAVGLALAVLVASFQARPGLELLVAPAFVVAATLLGVGIGFAASGLMVAYRDVQHVLPVFVQLTLFLSPVAYAASVVPASYRVIYHLNPLAGLVEGLRWSLLGLTPSSWPSVLYALGASALAFAIGIVVFRALEKGFADVI